MHQNASSPVSTGLRAGLHLLFFALAALVIVRALLGSATGGVPAVILGVAFVGVYVAGLWFSRASRERPVPRALVGLWLAGLTAIWAVLIWLSPDAAYLVFPLFFLYLAALPRPAALLAVFGTAALTIWGLGWARSFGVPGVLGPLVGAGIAIIISFGYQSLEREARARERLIADLVSARERLAATEREAGKLAERERLAREIHDTVAQALSSIQLLLHAAERETPRDPEAAAAHARRAREAAAEALAETRGLIDELAPPAITGASLAEALGRLAETTAAQSGLRVEFRESGERFPLSTPQKTALLRVAQGAISNAVRHASAARVDLSLSYLDGEALLDIVDDGRGFDPAALADRGPGGSFGLIAMRGRMEDLGGTLTISSAPGEGTSITAAVTE